MRIYKFKWMKGQSMPEKTVEARNTEDAYGQIRDFLKEENGTLVPGSIVMTKTETKRIADPPNLPKGIIPEWEC